jgi:hypothetical protein
MEAQEAGRRIVLLGWTMALSLGPKGRDPIARAEGLGRERATYQSPERPEFGCLIASRPPGLGGWVVAIQAFDLG